VYSHRASTPDPLYRRLVDGLLTRPRADAAGAGAGATILNVAALSVLAELCSTPHRGLVGAAANILWVRSPPPHPPCSVLTRPLRLSHDNSRSRISSGEEGF
jgi:hypothetical protein